MSFKRSILHLLALSGLLLTACTGGPTNAQATQARQPLRVLFIGNSLTFCNDLPGMVRHLAGHSPSPGGVEVESSTIAGATLRRNWNQGDALARIREGGWTHVVLQGQSTESITDRQGFREYVRRFDREIRSCGARTVLYMTWALQKAPQDQQDITDAYREIGREIGACVIPVGIARQNLLARQPAAPIYTRDGKHPTPEGTYLAACLFHAMLNGHSPVGLPSDIPSPTEPDRPLVSLPPEEAAVYQLVAAETARAAAASAGLSGMLP